MIIFIILECPKKQTLTSLFKKVYMTDKIALFVISELITF